jgi:glycosyltransferase involved in cell wall biosynthesis
VLLKAYGKAFSATDPVTLVIKTFPNPHNEIRQWLASAQKTTPHYPDVLLIEEDLSDAQLKALYQQCHALVAPSRAEGFGLPMAEAMLYGLPVITTGWSGQVDFCTPETAWLIDFTFAPAETHFGLFNSVWAEPDAGHLAQLMRDVYALPPEIRRQKSDAGRQRLMQNFKWKDVADRLVTAARSGSVLSAPPTPRIGWVSTWNTPCGIASYSAHLVGNLPAEVTILAPGEAAAADRLNVLRCWEVGEADPLDRLWQTIEERGIDSVVIQFNYGFFNFAHFSRFLTRLADSGKGVVLMMHATADPLHVPEKRLVQLAEAFARCQRVLVHSPNDLNRLKAIGLVDNVAIFPHGVVDYPVIPRVPTAALFTIASYGFFLPHKGLLELIEAMALLVAEGRAVCLRMINAAYPIAESATLIDSARKMVEQRGLTHAVQMVTDFLPDAESFGRLSEADLIVFPYQETGESSSAAVRYGLATGRAVAVTPLAIFDDVNRAVFRLPGTSPAEIASGIGQLIDDMASNDQEIANKQVEADRWRDAHCYSRLGSRLYGILVALTHLTPSPP